MNHPTEPGLPSLPFNSVLLSRAPTESPNELEIKLRHQSRKLRIVGSLAGGADLLFPVHSTTIAVRVYDSQRMSRLESQSKDQGQGQSQSQHQSRDVDGNVRGAAGVTPAMATVTTGESSSVQAKPCTAKVKQSFREAVISSHGGNSHAHVDGSNNIDGLEKPSFSGSGRGDRSGTPTRNESNEAFQYDFDKIRSFRDAFKHPVVFFLLPQSDSTIGGKQLGQVDSVMKMLQASLAYFDPSRRDGANEKRNGCARVFVVPDYASVLYMILNIQESLAPDRCQKKEKFFQREVERLLLGSLDENDQVDNSGGQGQVQEQGRGQKLKISQQTLSDHATAAFRKWADTFGISITDANVVMNVLGSLEKIAAADEQVMDNVPVDSDVKNIILSFFGGRGKGSMMFVDKDHVTTDIDVAVTDTSKETYNHSSGIGDSQDEFGIHHRYHDTSDDLMHGNNAVANFNNDGRDISQDYHQTNIISQREASLEDRDLRGQKEIANTNMSGGRRNTLPQKRSNELQSTRNPTFTPRPDLGHMYGQPSKSSLDMANHQLWVDGPSAFSHSYSIDGHRQSAFDSHQGIQNIGVDMMKTNQNPSSRRGRFRDLLPEANDIRGTPLMREIDRYRQHNYHEHPTTSQSASISHRQALMPANYLADSDQGRGYNMMPGHTHHNEPRSQRPVRRIIGQRQMSIQESAMNDNSVYREN
eukprot:CAMPEP_0194105712 /NCGR_PEP_ID=MMETSP0150-20130528/5880_1 /TAXON_ID=122233 /ORGANISM="Chaetoceros debilis, Strain MM31A-1" /LENGTH=699 /DNA_ID=CAMNT_0038793667 /DNA_START=253 /DNA_END=2349 /DNA_ORIENTATION=-